MKPKLKNQNDFELLSSHKESGFGVSQTVPNQALSIDDIMSRYVRDRVVPEVSTRPGVYSGDADDVDFDSPDLEKLRDADLADRHEFVRDLSAGISSAKEVLDARVASEEVASKAASKLAARRAKALDDLVNKNDEDTKKPDEPGK